MWVGPTHWGCSKAGQVVLGYIRAGWKSPGEQPSKQQSSMDSALVWLVGSFLLESLSCLSSVIDYDEDMQTRQTNSLPSYFDYGLYHSIRTQTRKCMFPDWIKRKKKESTLSTSLILALWSDCEFSVRNDLTPLWQCLPLPSRMGLPRSWVKINPPFLNFALSCILSQQPEE